MRELRKERDEDTLYMQNFILGVHDYPVIWNVFPVPLEVVLFPRQGVLVY